MLVLVSHAQLNLLLQITILPHLYIGMIGLAIPLAVIGIFMLVVSKLREGGKGAIYRQLRKSFQSFHIAKLFLNCLYIIAPFPPSLCCYMKALKALP